MEQVIPIKWSVSIISFKYLYVFGIIQLNYSIRLQRSVPGFVSILAVVVFVGVTVVIGYNRLISITRRSIIRQQMAPIQIVQWNIDSLKLIDSQRIVLHETVNPDLNIRQSCAIESVAKHHPDRPIQLIMRKTEEQLNLKPWINVETLNTLLRNFSHA